MAPVPKTSPDRDYNLMTQPRTPTEHEDNMNNQYWDSRGRRLFPQRRPSIPASARCNVNAMPCFPLFEPSPSMDRFRLEQQDHDSNTSSPSSVGSVGTVKVLMSPIPDQQFPKTDPQVGEGARVQTPCLVGSLPRGCSVELPITPYKSSNKSLQTNYSAPLYTSGPARGNIQWKSMAQFHKFGRRLRRRTLAQSPHSEQADCDSDKPSKPLVPRIDILEGCCPLAILPCQWSQSPEITAHPRLSSTEAYQCLGRDGVTHVLDNKPSRPGVQALEIAAWDCTVKLSTVATVTGNGRMHVHHLALFSVIMPTKERYAKKVSLSFVVTNALRNDHKRSLGPGQSSLLFREDISQPDFFPRQGAELLVVRDSCDLEKPLNLYFAFTYPAPCHSVMASLPTFRPKEGRLISEVVFIAEPLPPLSLKTSIRDTLSSWKLCHHPVSQVTCYERIDLPRLYAVEFQDDIQMRFEELDSVCFRALGDSTLSSVVWELDISVQNLPGGQVECQMSFFLEVGAATALVSVIPHGWMPLYFIVDGRVATVKVGECWKNKEGYITVFKQAHMAPGPIMIETYWQGPSNHDENNGYGTRSSPLPRIADRKVLGGRLACRDSETVLLNHLEQRIHSHGHVEGAYTRLPTMDAGYKILLQRVTRAHSQKSRPPTLVRPPPTSNPIAKVKADHEKGLSRAANKIEGKEAPPKQLFQALFIPLFILLLLIPGFLLFVEKVRKESNHTERTNLGDYERPQAVIDAVGLGIRQPALVAADGTVEVMKCEGWRDWIDYRSGWKGCVP